MPNGNQLARNNGVQFPRSVTSIFKTVLVEAAKIAPYWNPQLNAVHKRELKKGNRNRASLAVARKLVAYMMAVDKNQTEFIPHGEEKAA